MRVNVEQQTPEWHKWRAQGAGGSIVAAIMGENPWQTAYDAWCVKMGLKPEAVRNAAMQRGIDLEPAARAAYIKMVKIPVEPACFVDDEYEFMRCSLDGISECGSILFEAKCMGEKKHVDALNGIVPAYYNPQNQYNMMISKADRCHFVSYRPEMVGADTALIIVERDEDYIARMRQAVRDFWQLVISNTPPEQKGDDHILVVYPRPKMDEYVMFSEMENRGKNGKKKLRPDVLDWGDGGSFRAGRLKVTLTTPPQTDWKAYALELDPLLARVDEFTETKHKYTITIVKE